MSGFKVKIFTSEGSQSMSVSKSHLVVGSADHCDIQLKGGEIATEHLRIWSDGGHLWGQDLGAPQGTFLNGQPVPTLRPVMFHEADMFKLGDSDATLAFQALGSTTVIRAPAVNLVADTTDELVAKLEEQIKTLKAQNSQLQTEVEEFRDEITKKTRVPDSDEEEEISMVKHNALTEIQAMKEAESRRFDSWKQEAVEEMAKVVNKVFRKTDPKMSREDLCQDVTNALRANLLGEKTPAPRRRKHAANGWQRNFVTIVILGALAGVAIVYIKKSSHRLPASVILVPSPSKTVIDGRVNHARPGKSANP